MTHHMTHHMTHYIPHYMILHITFHIPSHIAFHSTRHITHGPLHERHTLRDGPVTSCQVVRALRDPPNDELRVMLRLPRTIRQEDGSRERFESIFQARRRRRGFGGRLVRPGIGRVCLPSTFDRMTESV